MAVAIYARKSTESEDRQVQSLEDQLKALRDLASREGILVTREFVEAKSAKEPGARPEFNLLVEAIRSKEIDGILTWQINRLSRNMVDGGLIGHFLHSGVLTFIKTPDRTFLPEDSALILAIETGAATSFIQDLRRNVRRGMEGKASRGWWPLRAPIGYINNATTKGIDIDPTRFYILQKGWEMLASGGFTVAEVCREFQKANLTGTDRGRPLAPSRIYALFRQEFYCGRFTFDGKQYLGRHTQMISPDTFERVQKILGGSAKPRDKELKHPFAGLFTCPVCGCRITAETRIKNYKTSGRQVAYSYYRCTGWKGCRGGAVRAERIEAALVNFASSIAIPATVRNWVEQSLASSLEHAGVQDISARDELMKSVHKGEVRLKRLRDMRIDQELSQEEYAAEKAEVDAKLIALRNLLVSSEILAEKITRTVSNRLQQLEEASSWKTMATTAKRAFLRAIASESFLTLEKLELRVDRLTAALMTIGPAVSSSQSENATQSLALNFDWYKMREDIRTLGDTDEASISELVTIQIDLDGPDKETALTQ